MCQCSKNHSHQGRQDIEHRVLRLSQRTQVDWLQLYLKTSKQILQRQSLKILILVITFYYEHIYATTKLFILLANFYQNMQECSNTEILYRSLIGSQYSNFYSDRITHMTISQSKLMIQLTKEQKIYHRSTFYEEVIEDIYSTICKIEPKNLMLYQFLTLIIEKEFIKNSNKLSYFSDLYDTVKGKNLENDCGYGKNNAEMEEQKFTKKKFIKLLKEMSNKLYPGYTNAYETFVYQKLTKSEGEEHKIKIDDSIKKMLNKETIATLKEYQHQLEGIFQIYMPENYNLNLEFAWQQIKVLEKKLPIVCFLKMLYEAEVVPHIISPVQFLDIIGKMKPPSIPSSNSNKQAMFYTTENITSYLRDYIHLSKIKILEGDIGLTYLQFQIFFIKIATQFCKDTKNQYPNNIKKIASFIQLKQAFEQTVPRKNRFMETVKNHMKIQSTKNEKIIVKKSESRKQIEDLYDTKDVQLKEEATKNIFKCMTISQSQIEIIKRDLDGELGELLPKKKIDKENEGYFDPEKRHVVIGQQLPKIPEKNKSNTQKDNKKKNDDGLMGYKPENLKIVQESNFDKLIRRPKKLRVNIEYPIVLNDVFYPSDLKPQLFISPKAELYLQTSYIHMGQRLYEQAFINCIRAKQLTESKSSMTELYYNLHTAQIFQSSGRDEIALSFYHKAKQLTGILTSVEGKARAQPYVGIGTSLYHLQEYEYALRCFQKARATYGMNLQIQSVENAILQNNIGCCLMMLNRNQEAIKYFEISHNIFDLKTGCFDEKTLVVQQNLNKNRKAYLQLLPEFKTMWKTYLEKSTTKLPTVKGSAKPKK